MIINDTDIAYTLKYSAILTPPSYTYHHGWLAYNLFRNNEV